MKTSILVLLPLLLCGSGLRAQQANPTPPDLPPGPPIQKRAPEYAQWLITTTVSGTAALDEKGQQASTAGRAGKGSQASSATKIMVTKTGKIYRVEHLDEHQQIWTVWASGATQVMVWPDRRSSALLAPSANPDAPNPFMTDFSKTDFPGFGWVDWKKFSQIKPYKGSKCIVFQEQQRVDSDDPTPEMVYITVTAYIDCDTRLPVALVSGDEANLFEWKPAPTGILSLPPSALAVLQQREKSEQQMAQQAARPY